MDLRRKPIRLRAVGVPLQSVNDMRGHKIRLDWLFVFAATLSTPRATAADFTQTVAPILARHCADCHSEKTKTSGYSVAGQASVIAGGNKHGKAVYPGDPARSPLIRILKGELQPAMPLGKTLAKADLEQIENWIRSLPPEESPRVSEWRWPFERPVKREPPGVKDSRLGAKFDRCFRSGEA